MVCVNTIAGPNKQCCGGKGSTKLADALEAMINARGIDATLERVVCLNQCHRGPSMRIAPGGRFFFEVSEKDLPNITDALEKVAGTKVKAADPMIFPGA